MMAGANPAAVQRIMRHTDPKVTTEIYGHLAPDYLRAEVDRLKFDSRPEALEDDAEPDAVAANGEPAAAPIFHQSTPGLDRSDPTQPTAKASSHWRAQRETDSAGNGRLSIPLPSKPRVPCSSHGGRAFAGPESRSDFPSRGATHSGSEATVCTENSPGGVKTGPRNTLRSVRGGVDDLISLAEVAKRLGVCRATAYSLVERGELPHVRISNAIRVSPADLAAFVAARRSGGRSDE